MTNSKQLELIESTSLQEDTLVNPSQSLDVKKLKKIQDTSGQSILGLSKNSNRLGLLEKTLVDTLNSVSTPYSRTWRVKVTPQERLVFQLRASVPATKGKGYGLLPTPTTSDATMGSIIGKDDKFHMTKNGTYRKVNRNGVSASIGLARLVHFWRTPDAAAGGSNLPGIKKALDEGHLKRPSGQQIQIRLQDQVLEPRLWPTPRAAKGMYMKMTDNMAKNRKKGYLENEVAYQGGIGGKLNPTWVEWLMGYPKGWTDLKA